MTLRSALVALLALLPLACTAQNATAPNSAPAPNTTSQGSPAAPATSAPVAGEAPAAAAGPKVTYNSCNVDGPYIAMTFDDGPHATFTPRLLDMLKERKLKATFFVVGQNALEYPQIMKRIVEEGHEIASHSWSHPNLGKMGEGSVTEQLQKTHDAIKQTTGVEPTVFRPPYGSFTANQKAWANRKWGYKTIMWDVDPLDWKIRNAARVHSAIVQNAVKGSIILAHDIHKTTVDAMPQTFDDLTAKGFKFVTVSELIAMDRPAPSKPKATPAPKSTSPMTAPDSAAAAPAQSTAPGSSTAPASDTEASTAPAGAGAPAAADAPLQKQAPAPAPAQKPARP